MTTGISLAFRPSVIRAKSAGSGADRKRKGGGNSGAAWWSPLFGWGADPDYIGSDDATSLEKAAARDPSMYYTAEDSRRRYSALTEEKARELRMRIMETESFHDVMYHSPIASRLASDVRRRSGY